MKGAPKSIGGPGKVSAAALSTCLANMRLYVNLAVEVVHSEFPQFELLQAFCLFDVQHAQQERLHQDDAMTSEHAARLCQVFGVDLETFQQQFYDHLPIAINEARCHKLSNPDAWKAAIRKTSSRRSDAKAHPSDELAAIAMRYVAYQGCCSSGVEQAFSKLQNQIAPARDHMTSENYLMEAKVVVDHDVCAAERQEVFGVAQEWWRRFFGRPRTSCLDRLDAGVPRKRKADSEASFLRKRRRHIQENCQMVSAQTVTRLLHVNQNQESLRQNSVSTKLCI